MKKNIPEFMLIYQCETCGIDSGFTDKDTSVKCYYCDKSTKMKLISKEVLTKKVMADRLKLVTDRLFKNLQSAYESMNKDERNMVSESGSDMEKEMLLLLNKAKEFKDSIENLNENNLKGL